VRNFPHSLDFSVVFVESIEMTDAVDKTVHLVSQEGESFDVPLNVAKMSELVKTMVDEDQDDEEAQEIPLPNVKSSILAKVIEFIKHYKVDPMYEIEKVLEYLVTLSFSVAFVHFSLSLSLVLFLWVGFVPTAAQVRQHE
jgi:hypothetical protein